MDKMYLNQVRLLLRVLPLVAEENDFALKGGTAINLFERNLPRLSVDIDLTYLPFDDRAAALANVGAALARIKDQIEQRLRLLRPQGAYASHRSVARLDRRTPRSGAPPAWRDRPQRKAVPATCLMALPLCRHPQRRETTEPGARPGCRQPYASMAKWLCDATAVYLSPGPVPR